jgi:uncharacterized membrane protein YjgN (DUF898 family)
MNSSTARLRYHGTGAAFFGLVLVNVLLTVVTLGIYSFWAKNKVREFHYSHTELDGDRFAYHGTGGELFRGYLKAVGVIFFIAIVVGLLNAIIAGPSASPGMAAGIGFLFYVAIGLLMIVAVNGARRYRFSRSSWRGIRFSFHGDVGDWVGLVTRGMLLSIVTLGFYLPHFQSQRRAFLVNNARFGSEPFMYDGDGRELVGAYVKAVLLTIPTLGIYWLWYSAFKQRYFWEHTAMRGARFRSTVTGSGLLKLTLTNLLFAIVTLGIGVPWVITRTHSFWCDNLSLQGTVEWASIEQRADAAGVAAEGLADAFDVDVGLGM